MYCSDDANNLSIEDKVNYLVLREYLISFKILKNTGIVKKNTNEIIESINPTDHKAARYIKLLLLNYVQNNRKEFFSNTKKMLSNKRLGLTMPENWLIFLKYMKYKEFKKLF